VASTHEKLIFAFIHFFFFVQKRKPVLKEKTSFFGKAFFFKERFV